MSNQYESMILVRIPKDIKDALMKLRKQENLSTLGSALKFWFEQQNQERMEKELSELKTMISKLADAILRSHKKSNFLSIALTSLADEAGGEGKVIEDGIRRIDKASISKLKSKDWLTRIFEKTRT